MILLLYSFLTPYFPLSLTSQTDSFKTWIRSYYCLLQSTITVSSPRMKCKLLWWCANLLISLTSINNIIPPTIMYYSYSWLRSVPLMQWFSKCDPWTSNITITWWFVRLANIWNPCQTCSVRKSGAEAQMSCVLSLWRWFWNMLKLEDQWVLEQVKLCHVSAFAVGFFLCQEYLTTHDSPIFPWLALCCIYGC